MKRIFKAAQTLLKAFEEDPSIYLSELRPLLLIFSRQRKDKRLDKNFSDDIYRT